MLTGTINSTPAVLNYEISTKTDTIKNSHNGKFKKIVAHPTHLCPFRAFPNTDSEWRPAPTCKFLTAVDWGEEDFLKLTLNWPSSFTQRRFNLNLVKIQIIQRENLNPRLDKEAKYFLHRLLVSVYIVVGIYSALFC